jgi:hypothetical protein
MWRGRRGWFELILMLIPLCKWSGVKRKVKRERERERAKRWAEMRIASEWHGISHGISHGLCIVRSGEGFV